MSNTCSRSATTDRLLMKIKVLLEGYKSGEHIHLKRMGKNLERLDKRIQMRNDRLAGILRVLKEDFVVYVNGRWYKK